MIKITLKDGSVKEIENKMSILDIAKSISEGLARMATAGEVDGKVQDLRYVVEKDCSLNILTFESSSPEAKINEEKAKLENYKQMLKIVEERLNSMK